MHIELWQATWLESLVTLVSTHLILTTASPGVIRRRGLLIGILLYIPSAIGSFVFTGSAIGIVSFLICTLLPFVAPLFTIRGLRKRTVIYITLLYIGFSGFFVFIFNSLAMTVGFSSTGRIVIDAIANILLLSGCIQAGRKRILPNIYNDFMVLDTRIKVLLMVSVWLGTAFANFFAGVFRSIPRSPFVTLTELLAYALVLLVFIICPMMTASNVANSYNAKMLAVADKHAKAQAAHYAVVTKANEDIRKFKHDADNLRIGLAQLLAVGDVQGALEMLGGSMKPQHSEIEPCETGNMIADALLYEKMTLAETSGIRISFDGVMPTNEQLAPIDLCAILGNALDNAIEACEKLPNAESNVIAVSSELANGYLFLSIVNPVVNDVKIVNNNIATSKGDSIAHGLGLGSIRNAVSKYGGEMRLSCENNLFRLEADVYLRVGVWVDINSVE